MSPWPRTQVSRAPIALIRLAMVTAVCGCISPRFADRQACEKDAQQAFDRCTEAALAGALPQPGMTDFRGQVDPSGLRDHPQIDRSECTRAYERQLMRCAELPDANPSLTPLPVPSGNPAAKPTPSP